MKDNIKMRAIRGRVVQLELTSEDQAVVIGLGDVSTGIRLFGPYAPQAAVDMIPALPQEQWVIMPVYSHAHLLAVIEAHASETEEKMPVMPEPSGGLPN